MTARERIVSAPIVKTERFSAGEFRQLTFQEFLRRALDNGWLEITPAAQTFAMPGGAAVSNYHRRRPLPAVYEPIAREALTLTERLAACAALPAFSADYLFAASGELLSLEGGLGYDGGRLVDTCCFDAPPRPGEAALRPTGRRRAPP